jgi:hypothetical protein
VEAVEALFRRHGPQNIPFFFDSLKRLVCGAFGGSLFDLKRGGHAPQEQVVLGLCVALLYGVGALGLH